VIGRLIAVKNKSVHCTPVHGRPLDLLSTNGFGTGGCHGTPAAIFV